MKTSEVRPCDKCKSGLGLSPVKITIERFMMDVTAARQALGLEMILGPLAKVMGPDEEIFKAFDKKEVLLCLACAIPILGEFIE